MLRWSGGVKESDQELYQGCCSSADNPKGSHPRSSDTDVSNRERCWGSCGPARQELSTEVSHWWHISNVVEQRETSALLSKREEVVTPN